LAVVNLAMLAWMLVRLLTPSPRRVYCMAITPTGGGCRQPPPPGAHAAGVVRVVLLWLLIDVVLGGLWLVTNDRAKRIRSRCRGLPY
jgi:hypothetical protein